MNRSSPQKNLTACPPPRIPTGWRAVFDQNIKEWVFIDPTTGRRQIERPLMPPASAPSAVPESNHIPKGPVAANDSTPVPGHDVSNGQPQPASYVPQYFSVEDAKRKIHAAREREQRQRHEHEHQHKQRNLQQHPEAQQHEQHQQPNLQKQLYQQYQYQYQHQQLQQHQPHNQPQQQQQQQQPEIPPMRAALMCSQQFNSNPGVTVPLPAPTLDSGSMTPPYLPDSHFPYPRPPTGLGITFASPPPPISKMTTPEWPPMPQYQTHPYQMPSSPADTAAGVDMGNLLLYQENHQRLPTATPLPMTGAPHDGLGADADADPAATPRATMPMSFPPVSSGVPMLSPFSMRKPE